MSASIGKRDPDKQGHRTPREFLDAVERRFGLIGFDLAATLGHEVTDRIGYPGSSYTPEDDALSQDWTLPNLHKSRPVAWLNPPFANIRPWVAKLDAECKFLPRWTLCLIPASMGSKWWRDHVLGKCMAFGVTRMAFVGSETIYPKDLALLAYGFGVHGTGFWDWREMR